MSTSRKSPKLPPGYTGARADAAGPARPVKRPGSPAASGSLPGSPPKGPPLARPKKKTVEDIKIESRGLRGELPTALQEESDHVGEAARQVLKFHGVYQQDDRDHRDGGRSYMFMVRTRIPGGRLTPEQYLVHDDLADRFGGGSLRITTRQDFQLHGVIKRDLKSTIRAINEALLTTLSACGDVARNTVLSPAPATDRYHDDIERVAEELGGRLLPRTRAYHDIWLNGEKVHDGEADSEVEPLYGEAYLPRKFKVGIAYPGDNSIDVYSQDVGLIAIVRDEQLVGFNVLAGGGLGMTHNRSETYPRLADPLGFATVDQVVDAVEAIVRIQRDHGNRENRRLARLKYLIDSWGLDRFRAELEKQLGYRLAPVADQPPMELRLYLGWTHQRDGRWTLGLPIENGRVRGTLKTGIRELVQRFGPGVRLTAHQDILFTDIPDADRVGVDALLESFRIPTAPKLTNLRKYAMACPALPTCGLALTESERVMPTLIDRLEEEIGILGLQDEILSVRMTGCPNGCARPYVADIGLVGRSGTKYALFLGGTSRGTRLNQLFQDLVELDEVVPTLRPILIAFREEREPEESFGDYCERIGMDELARKHLTYPADQLEPARA